jgi:phage terminase small subunit
MSHMKKEKWDGRSRISTEKYKENWNDIFGKEVTLKDLKNVLTEEEWTNKLLKKKWDFPKKLTEQQIKFANILIAEEGRKTATQCAIEAGYAKDSARQAASKLQNPKLYPLVVQYIGELRAEWQKKYDVTFGSHITELAKLRDEAREKKAWSAAVNAEVARGKAAGLYVEQKIIRTGKLEDLTTEELESRMKQIIDEYSPILEGIEIQELVEKVKEQPKELEDQTSD